MDNVSHTAAHGDRLQAAQRAASGKTMRLLAGVAAGNFVEWFDFAVYGYSASTIARLFFPGSDPTSGLLATLAIFGVTFLFRPAGGIFFGKLGDRVGRRNTLSIIILMMGACTTLIGFLPTYANIGVLAPLLLAVLRLGQGFSGGGEASGSSTFLSEHAPAARRGLWTGISNSSQTLPFVVAAILMTVIEASMSRQAFLSWGWRIPFLLSAPLSLIGLYLRARLEDTPAFVEIQRSGRIVETPIRTVLTHYRKQVLLLAGVASLNALAFYTMSSYMTTYLKQVIGLSPTISLVSNAVALLLYSLLIPFFGSLGDRYGRKRIVFAGALGLALTSVPGYLLAAQGGMLNAILGQCLITVFLTLTASVVAVVQCELFPTEVRYSGAALGYNLGYMLFGGTAPFVAQYLVVVTGAPLSPAFYMSAVALLALVPIAMLPETAGTKIAHSGTSFSSH
ncbi:MFS transporter [Paraburkholderia susongensis]|uniref:MFS transporter, MHS family, proline/betaine transporter n=1 Tax=Paraburkholderia susongensis TaxID=1515439 RepID=A0A1X7L7R8_9BURK|nr:MFS transporter [Paraburkholderia susongensis]SMG49597.1 MFS transporter, MHS family, proline/betaine transporter [Paraburkholderia susongensis]